MDCYIGVFRNYLSPIQSISLEILLEPLGYSPKLANSFMAVMAGYLSNLGIPRSGEFLRGGIISSYEKHSFQKSFWNHYF
ncbi:hypothetical protein [Aquimarina hainanensis]|uniref:hypothetical protein n=1 Tax=Aquimarina hainanensis TaxID=1578017 RepID=UPI00361163F2